MTEQDTVAPDLPAVTREGDEVRMKLADFDELIMRLLIAEGSDESCTEHCDEFHPDDIEGDDALRAAVTALAEAHHRSHDERFPWRLCSNDACREIAFALLVR